MKGFADQVTFVLGGSMGIGLSVARLLAESGAHVLVVARRPEPLDRARALLESVRVNDAQRLETRALDLVDAQATARVLQEAMADFGVPDLVVNTVGRAVPRPFEEVDDTQFRTTLEVNLHSVWNACKVVAPAMKARGRGRLVTTSSIVGFMGVYGYTDYAASKFGVVGLSEALRQELGPHGVGVTVLYPPDTETPGFQVEEETKPPETRAVSGKVTPMQPDDVARALLKGVRRGRDQVVPGFDGKLTHAAKRLLPGLVDRVMFREIRKLRRKGG